MHDVTKAIQVLVIAMLSIAMALGVLFILYLDGV